MSGLGLILMTLTSRVTRSTNSQPGALKKIILQKIIKVRLVYFLLNLASFFFFPHSVSVKTEVGTPRH